MIQASGIVNLRYVHKFGLGFSFYIVLLLLLLLLLLLICRSPSPCYGKETIWPSLDDRCLITVGIMGLQAQVGLPAQHTNASLQRKSAENLSDLSWRRPVEQPPGE